MAQNSCIICDNTTDRPKQDLHTLNYLIDCPQCGKYQMSNEMFADFSELYLDKENFQKKKHIISYCIRKKYDLNMARITLDNDFIKQSLESKELNLSEKIDALLIALSKDSEDYTSKLYVPNGTNRRKENKYIAQSQLKNVQEFYFFKEHLSQNKYLKWINCEAQEGDAFSITPEGWQFIESLQRQTNSNKVFVAMWFGNDETLESLYPEQGLTRLGDDNNLKSSEALNTIYEKGIEKAIKDNQLTPCRVDKIEHIDKIDDKIISEINTSRFVIADFTGHRGGVYFEAGYAIRRNIPVIWTCHKDDLKKLHFDIRQYNMIDWENIDDLRTRLSNRIKALITT